MAGRKGAGTTDRGDDAGLGREVRERIAALAEAQDGSFRAEDIAEIAEDIMASMSGDLSAVELQVYGELDSLARFIRQARSDIAALRPQDIASQDIPSATDELDAIIGATEEATSEILDAGETLENIAAALPEDQASAMTDAVTRIYEACNFQDITGQRITKVVKTLKHIESKVDQLLQALGGDQGDAGIRGAGTPDRDAEDTASEDDLLNGPQLPESANSQDDIDAILAEFDK